MKEICIVATAAEPSRDPRRRGQLKQQRTCFHCTDIGKKFFSDEDSKPFVPSLYSPAQGPVVRKPINLIQDQHLGVEK